MGRSFTVKIAAMNGLTEGAEYTKNEAEYKRSYIRCARPRLFFGYFTGFTCSLIQSQIRSAIWRLLSSSIRAWVLP